MHYMLVIHSAEGKSIARISEVLGCGSASVRRTRQRWREYGKAGLIDAREDNAGHAKADEAYLTTRSGSNTHSTRFNN